MGVVSCSIVWFLFMLGWFLLALLSGKFGIWMAKRTQRESEALLRDLRADGGIVDRINRIEEDTRRMASRSSVETNQCSTGLTGLTLKWRIYRSKGMH